MKRIIVKDNHLIFRGRKLSVSRRVLDAAQTGWVLEGLREACGAKEGEPVELIRTATSDPWRAAL